MKNLSNLLKTKFICCFSLSVKTCFDILRKILVPQCYSSTPKQLL